MIIGVFQHTPRCLEGYGAGRPMNSQPQVERPHQAVCPRIHWRHLQETTHHFILLQAQAVTEGTPVIFSLNSPKIYASSYPWTAAIQGDKGTP